MFVTVRYGDEKKRIFNAHCKNEVLLQSIKSQCDCGEKDVVELSDERGVVKNLRHFPSDYGSEFLKERETVVLLSVKDVGNKEETEGERPVFTPLLTSLASNQDFIDTLNPDGGEDAMADGSKRQLVDIVENEDDNNKSSKSKTKQNTKDTQSSNTPTQSSKKTFSRKSTKSSLKK